MSARAIAISHSEGAGVMKNWRTVSLHVAVAAAFMFLLQRFVLNAALESSLLWAVVFGGCAAVLATMQANR